MNAQQQSMYHHAFIVSTDRKSLNTRLKNSVQKAQEDARKELNHRRNTLKQLLETEDQIYEEEFANKVKSRIDEDIRERKDNLLKIKEENTKNKLKFLESKRIQQYMNSCYEIREALRSKEKQNIKECQLEQMLEKEQALKRELDLEKYWLEVQHNNLKLMDKYQAEEDCLKNAITKHVTETRRMQLEELQEKRQHDCLEKLEEKNKLSALLEELRLEEFDQKTKRNLTKVNEYRNELLEMIRDKKAINIREEQEKAEMHRKMMREIAELEAEENAVAREKKKNFYKATIDFIKYVKGVRQLEEQKEQICSKRIEELRRIDLCTKNNILLERQRKARLAEKCFAELKQQICEQYKKRLQEEDEYRSCKILENRFVQRDLTKEEILAQKQENRKKLEKQIEELKKIRESEIEKFSQDLKKATNDPAFCADLAEKYIREGVDYLKPHPNWRIIATPSAAYCSLGNLQAQGATPKRSLETCDCVVHGPQTISNDGRGDE